MPSTYAHRKFAEKVLPLLPEEARRAAEGNTGLYLIGCHGPDILFYYKPVTKNAVNRLGYAMHEESALPFFERAKSLVKEGGEPSLAYTMGFITHFALDSTCHGYVESGRRELGVTHTKLEVEFDRMLLERDGKEPLREILTTHINPTESYGEVIAPYFSLTQKEIVRSLKDMRRICNLFVCPGRVKRAIVGGVLKLINAELPDQIMAPVPDARCAASNARMAELFEEAVPVAAQLAANFAASLNCGENLSQRFDRNYE